MKRQQQKNGVLPISEKVFVYLALKAVIMENTFDRNQSFQVVLAF